MPSWAISVACHDPCSHTPMGKKLGSVGIPRDHAAYGLVQASAGMVGAHEAGASPPGERAPPDVRSRPGSEAVSCAVSRALSAAASEPAPASVGEAWFALLHAPASAH